MPKYTIILMLWSFMLFFTTSPFSQGAIKQDDVLMAFTFAQGVSKIGQVANGILKDVYGNGNDG